MLNITSMRLLKRAAIIFDTARAVASLLRRCFIKRCHLATRRRGLDVFKQELTSPDNPLLTLENVISSQYMAGAMLQIILDVQDGKLNPENTINPKVYH